MLKENVDFSIELNVNSIRNLFSKNIYDGLYLADSKANTLQVNNSYEKISLLPEFDLKGKNLQELEEKGYFSKSVTLIVLNRLRLYNSINSVSIKQKIITGKEALVTGIPLFSNNNVKYIVTVVKEIMPINLIGKKLMDLSNKKLWNGFDSKNKTNNIVTFNDTSIIANDEKTKKMIRNIEKASFYSLPILLTGETGVGKDVMAKYLHYLKCKQHNRNLPFIMVNCSAIPKELLEIEMFGYTPGAFSGASKSGKKGLIELADGGILFLNEIGDMPLELQSKFLTILDNGTAKRVGGLKEYKANFQLISATNRNLQDSIDKKQFREDFYYRINGININIPPLRHRKDDILPIIFYFINKIKDGNATLKNKIMSSSVLDILLNYRWPGNIRELFNIMNELYTLSSGNIITIRDVPNRILKYDIETNHTADNQNTAPLKDSVRMYETQLIKNALKELGSITEAAKFLGIDVSTLRRKLRKT